jgi:lysophospholipase L1-like esterase
VLALASVQAARMMYAREKAAAVFPDRQPPAAETRSLAAKHGRRIVLFGDSRIVQWTGFPSEPGTEVVARGIAGETTAQMRLRFEADVLAADPDLVVMQMGINDLVAIGVLPARRAEIAEQTARNIDYFVDALGARGIRVVLLTIIPPADPPLWRKPFWSEAIAEEVRRLNGRWLSRSMPSWVSVVDTGALLQDGAGQWRRGVLSDTLHLTPVGYDHLNAKIVPLLQDRTQRGGRHAVQ